MRRLDPRNILAILFVLAGALPVAWWLGSWLYNSATRAQIVQAALVMVVLYVAWWFRKRAEKT
jgi:drug/metabolite transporter (DMT)-like permease